MSDVLIKLLEIVEGPKITLAVLLGLFLLAARFLDNNVRIETKNKLFLWTFGERHGSADAGGIAMSRLHNALAVVYATSRPLVFIFRCVLISLVVISLIFTLQYTLSPDAFAEYSLPFFANFVNHGWSVVIIIAGVLAVDVVSTAQTFTFLRLIRYCRNAYEAIFIGCADIILSVFLFIIIFPAFAAIAFLVFPSKQSELTFFLKSELLAQNPESVRAIVRYMAFNPRALFEDEYDDAKIPSDANEHGAFLGFQISLTKTALQSTKLEDFKSTKPVGSILIYQKGITGESRLLELLPGMLNASDSLRAAKLLEKDVSLFGSVALFKAVVPPKPSLWSLAASYGNAFGLVDFLGDRFASILRLGPVVASSNDFQAANNINNIVHSRDERILYYCDGVYGKSEDPIKKSGVLKKCREGAAISEVSPSLLSQMSAAWTQDTLDVPLAPFAWSSLSTTLIIYYFTFFGIALRIFRRITSSHFVGVEEFLENRPFTATSLMLSALFIPLLIGMELYVFA